MAKNKGPFRGFTIEDVIEAETHGFAVQLGNDFYSKNGSFVFSYSEANKHYKNILSKIVYAINNGTNKQQKDALRCLVNFKVLPLRWQ
jgi:hypothetical protein